MFLLPSSRASRKMPSSRFACLINHLLCRLKLFELTHFPWNTRKNIACGGRGQLWHVTCAEGRDLSNYVRMSTIQLRRPEKRQKPRNVDPKIPMKRLVPLPTCASSHLESYDPKSCPKMFFPPKWSLVNAQQKKQKWGKKSNRRGEERKLLKLTFCIWNRRPRNVWNGVLGSFGSL